LVAAVVGGGGGDDEDYFVFCVLCFSLSFGFVSEEKGCVGDRAVLIRLLGASPRGENIGSICVAYPNRGTLQHTPGWTDN